MSTISTRRRRAIATSSWLAIGLAMACTNSAFAQAGASSGPIGETAVDEVIVVGTRASQQSSIARKKNAKTAVDSIVADDVGSFPDRNINEAISRVAGTALDRNDFGEGQGVAIRGNGPDFTRVELDGMGVQSTFQLSLGTGSARAADLRELPADLIKSVDIVKGSTADMTEGSLGGGVRIQTRTGLDFRKPYLSVRLGAEANSVSAKWTPDFNIVASRKFLDDRLGVIFSGNYRAVRTDGHGSENVVSNNRGHAAHWDWDNSAEKTYEYNPALTNGEAADVVLGNSVAGPGRTTGVTPRELLATSAAQTSKQGCLDAFPFLPTTATTDQRTQRVNEQLTCLNQWNDYAPSLLRVFMNSQEDKRTSMDLRFDYRVSDNLTVFAKVNRSERLTDDQNRGRNLGLYQVNPAGRFTTTTATATVPGQRYVNEDATGTGAGFFQWTRSTVLPNTPPSCPDITPVAPQTCTQTNPMIGRGPDDAALVGGLPVWGLVTNIDPASVVVDANHNITSFDIYNNSASIDQIDNYQPSVTNYAQLGANYIGERLKVDFMLGMTKATSTRLDYRTSRAYNYGKATVTRQPSSGLWQYTLPGNYDDTIASNFVQVSAPLTGTTAVALSETNQYARPAYTTAQLPLVTPSFDVTMRPRAGESTETVAKIDLTYDTSDIMPFFTAFKTGFNYRSSDIESWGGGGSTIRDAVGAFGSVGYIPPIILPGANVNTSSASDNGNFRACRETTASAALRDGIIGSNETADVGLCNFGFVQFNPHSREGLDTLTEAQMLALFTDTLEPNGLVPFRTYADLGPGWQGIRTGDLFSQLGNGQFTNLDCLKFCTANDGKVYAQPAARSNETIMNLYYMVEFEEDNLPFGMVFNGNVGLRGVHSQIEATGNMTLNFTRVTGVVNNVPQVTTTTFRQNVGIQRTTMDWLPSYNLALWVVPDKVVLRYYTAKTVARPRVSQLIPGGTCTIDERNFEDSAFYDGDDNNGCASNGRVGNPGLKPFTAINQNVSIEWYPNRDTTLSLAWHESDVLVGNVINTTETGALFANSTAADPVTGDPASRLIFTYPTFANGPGFRRTGLEFSSKTAFTFLPWLLRYTGVDFNYSTLTSGANKNPIYDPITGDVMDPIDESDYFMNLSLWYDDGRTQVRLSNQSRGAAFNCITPCGGNNTNRNFPGEGMANVGVPYYVGEPRFSDETKFWDLKVSHNLNPNIQVFIEGTNITRQANTTSAGEYRPYADGTPKLSRLSYAGSRVRTGVVFKFQ